MKPRIRFALLIGLALTLATSAFAQTAPDGPPPPGANPGAGGWQGQRGGRGGGMMGGMAGGRGLMGTVTGVTADHYTVKTELGETYTVHFSVNTRIMKQTAQRRGEGGGGEGMGMGGMPPQALKPSDIKVGDAIAAMGEIDNAAKSVGAVMVMQIDPERAKQMQEMRANYGKTWIMGKVTAIDGVKVTLMSTMDNAAHSFVADENTTFRQRREPITLADLQVGDTVRVEGAVKDGAFVAAAVNSMGPQGAGAALPAGAPPPMPK